jgi:hypothetical protein
MQKVLSLSFFSFLLHKFLVVFLNAFERHYGMEVTVGFWGSDFLFDYELW